MLTILEIDIMEQHGDLLVKVELHVYHENIFLMMVLLEMLPLEMELIPTHYLIPIHNRHYSHILHAICGKELHN